MVPWADPMSWFTHAFEQTVGYLAQESSKTVVSTMMRAPGQRSARSSVAWSKGCFPDKLAGLTHIGVDELSYRKPKVRDHRRRGPQSGRVVWARVREERRRSVASSKSLERRARSSRPSRSTCRSVHLGGVRSAPNAQIIFDRFHVQRLVKMRSTKCVAPRCGPSKNQAPARAEEHSVRAAEEPWNLTDIERRS
jgi:transposase